ncbi:hypothetical protein Cs7R123_56620 [Catellatospora sp. TT07R-123]|uniref:hypothetical protein n=1 Tax=Catellatospora sp. TT07R-123 TaxID=2733863 RepID=UPI001B2882B0|nr:hypothetical protein [Catellatospora sp. TT07R-123]GHJ48320.1 hypothetical protein Cs7R123_56620 [Catellatospora sp. TT07R-123]
MTENEDEVRAALAALVADEPDLPGGTADIERRGVRRRNRRFAAIGALVATPLLVGVVAVAAWPTPQPQPLAQPPAASPTQFVDPNAGTQLATGFPLGSAVDAVAGALPAGVALAELPMDLSWQADGSVRLPLAAGGELTVAVAGGTCTASAAALETADAAKVADALCAAWVALGSPPVAPAGPAPSDQPDLAAR